MNSNKIIRPNESNLKIIAFHCCIYAFLICLLIIYNAFNLEPEILIYPSCVFLIALTIWSLWSWQLLTKTLFDPYVLFFISALVFNGGQTLLEVFHLNKNGILEDNFSSTTLLKTLFIVIFGLASFHMGGLLSAANNQVIYPKPFEKKASIQTNKKNCYQVGFCLLSVAFFPTVSVIKDAIVVVLQSGYSALYQQDDPTSFNATPRVLSAFIIPAILFLLAGSKSRKNYRLVCVFTMLIYSVSRFFLGERNQAVMPLIAFAWLWHRLIHPLSKSFFISFASLMIFLIFPLIGITRNEADEDRLSISFLVDAFSSLDNPFIASISEMGTSMQTVAYTLELVPSVKGFEMGVGYLYALLTLMPNFFWKIHPTIARGIPDLWLTWEVNPGWASRNGTIGFSFIAEAYLNFGWFGTPIILAAIGFFLGKLTLWAVKSDNPAKLAATASFLSFFLFYPRASAALVVRPVVWYSLIPYLGVCTLGWSQSKRVLR